MDFLHELSSRLLLVLSITTIAIAVASFLVFKLYANYFQPFKIQHTPYNFRLFSNDALWTVLNISGVVVVGVILQRLWINGIIEFNTSSPSIFTLIFEFIVVFFLFDFAYYLMHKTLHLEPFYSRIHIHHHKTLNPNFLTSYAFHPIEGVSAALINVILVLALDFHVHTIFTALIYQGLMSLHVHFAHEYFPKGWLDKWYTKWFITPLFHDLHHSRVNYNFGGFTIMPDYLFGTLTPDLKKIFDEIKEGKMERNQFKEGKSEAGLQALHVETTLENQQTIAELKDAKLKRHTSL